jgi:hypothetical protein
MRFGTRNPILARPESTLFLRESLRNVIAVTRIAVWLVRHGQDFGAERTVQSRRGSGRLLTMDIKMHI